MEENKKGFAVRGILHVGISTSTEKTGESFHANHLYKNSMMKREYSMTNLRV